MADSGTKTPRMPLTLVMLALSFVLVVQGAVPFLAMPTLGQAVWLTGFSQSFVNQSLFAIYADNFGVPGEAAIAFGLAGAWPAGVLIYAGLHPGDAYSATVAIWMTAAFFAAYALGRRLGVLPVQAVLGAVCWLCLPVVWAHADYSMVSVGIALLPLYFLAAINLFWPLNRLEKPSAKAAILYLMACLVSVFMDGYSFMMFASGASLLAAWIFVSERHLRSDMLRYGLPAHIVSFLLSYAAYTTYLGKTGFAEAPLDFFRGWGADLTYLLIPSEGMHWLPDRLGFSVERTQVSHFGDASVWRTTFLLPLILCAVVAVARWRHDRGLKWALVLVAALGFYMSLGPSLKVSSTKPPGSELGPLMPAKYAWAPTGSAFLSANVPGFNNMRASYRWAALGAFAAWALAVTLMSGGERRRRLGSTMVFGAIVISLPNLSATWRQDTAYRSGLHAMEDTLMSDISRSVSPSMMVAFLPWRNDFLVNYLAARLQFQTYNIGGDKNLNEARSRWPQTMSMFRMGQVDEGFAERVVVLLRRGEADVVILPYLDLLWAAHVWPYPNQYKKEVLDVASELASFPVVEVAEHRYHAAVTATKSAGGQLAAPAGAICIPPECLKRPGFWSGTPTMVGKTQDGSIVSSGKGGYLLFGPYVPMNAGNYDLTVFGAGTQLDGSWVDVASAKGAVRHETVALSDGIGDGEALVETSVRLDRPVEDLEVRVYASDGSSLRVDGYSLLPSGRSNVPN